MSFKQKLKRFFRAKDASDSAVEVLQHFILPFSRQFKGRNTTIDDVLEAFFNTEHRRFYYLVAKRDFKLPGRYFTSGNVTKELMGPRAVKKGQRMLVALDRKDDLARVETVFDGKSHNYLLKSWEFKTIAEWCDVLE